MQTRKKFQDHENKHINTHSLTVELSVEAPEDELVVSAIPKSIKLNKKTNYVLWKSFYFTFYFFIIIKKYFIKKKIQ